MFDVGQVLVELGVEGRQLVHVGVERGGVVLAQNLAKNNFFSTGRGRFELGIFDQTTAIELSHHTRLLPRHVTPSVTRSSKISPLVQSL